MALPFFKLGTLALKTICKPIASRLKREATIHPQFRQLIIDLAQANHRFTTQMTRRMYGHRTDVEIRPLNEEKAVQVASDLIGEGFVFAVAGALVIFEVQRSAHSEARKEKARKDEMEGMRQRDESLAGEIEAIKQRLEGVDAVKQRLEALEQLTKEVLERSSKSQPVAKGKNGPS